MSEIIKKALINYLKVHGKKLYSIAKTINQKYIYISISALFRYHEPNEQYPKLMVAVNEVIKEGGVINDEIVLVKKNSEIYIRIPLEKIPQYF